MENSNNRFKFRAWDKKNNKMLTQMLLGGYIAMVGMPFIKDLEIMQFTGLYDKNGKEIYEGDIIANLPVKRKEETHWQNKTIVNFSLVPRSDGEYGGSFFGYLFDFDNISQYEVIGNIYENTDLLK